MREGYLQVEALAHSVGLCLYVWRTDNAPIQKAQEIRVQAGNANADSLRYKGVWESRLVHIPLFSEDICPLRRSYYGGSIVPTDLVVLRLRRISQC